MSDSSYSRDSSYGCEDEGAAQYFGRQPIIRRPFSEAARRLFGTIQSSVKNTAVIKPLPSFDMVYAATLQCSGVDGEVFDMLGQQYDPLYVARFNGPVVEGAEVYVDAESIEYYDGVL